MDLQQAPGNVISGPPTRPNPNKDQAAESLAEELMMAGKRRLLIAVSGLAH
jgi:hypothetical protein